MATLSTTTADNYLTITVNGTTIKQLWAKKASDGTSVKIYQKWKSVSSTSYGESKGMRCTSQLAAYSSKTWYSGHRSYVYYYFEVRCDLDAWSTNNGAYFRTRYYDPGWTLKHDTTRYTGSGSSTGRYKTTTYGYTTVYRSSDSNYDQKSYTGYLYVNKSISDGSGGTKYDSDTSRNVSTPSVTDKSSTSKSNSSGWIGGDCYVGTTSTTTSRVQDN